VKRTRFLIPDSSSRIAALARFPNPEQQSCRQLFRYLFITTSKHNFFGTAVNALSLGSP
jgi:hypothetical protein